jgi:predicted aconitase with swiveling domain
MTSVQAEVLVSGPTASGEALVLGAPISFWGGVDPKSGRIADVRHPDLDKVIAGRVLFLPGTIGSSSASAVLLELVHAGFAPAAIVLNEPDAILLLGLIVAREMGWPAPIALKLPRSEHRRFEGAPVSVSADGLLTAASRS